VQGPRVGDLLEALANLNAGNGAGLVLTRSHPRLLESALSRSERLRTKEAKKTKEALKTKEADGVGAAELAARRSGQGVHAAQAAGHVPDVVRVIGAVQHALVGARGLEA
jgi:hypothetical protein